MPKIIWFEDNADDKNSDPYFVVADKITDATIMYPPEDIEDEYTELTIGLSGSGSRWRSVLFKDKDAAENALNSLSEILLDYIEPDMYAYAISKEDGDWRHINDE